MTPEQIALAAMRRKYPAAVEELADLACAGLRREGLLNVGGSDRGQQLAPSSGLAPDSAVSVGPDTHPSSSDPISNFVAPPHEGRALLGAPKPLSPEEWAVVDEFEKAFAPRGLDKAMREIDEGEWPEVGC